MNDESPEDAHFAVEFIGISGESFVGGLVSECEFEGSVGVDDDAENLARAALFHSEDLVDETEFVGLAVVVGGEMVVVGFGPWFDDEFSGEAYLSGAWFCFGGFVLSVACEADGDVGLEVVEEFLVAACDDDGEVVSGGEFSEVVCDGDGESVVESGAEFVADEQG